MPVQENIPGQAEGQVEGGALGGNGQQGFLLNPGAVVTLSIPASVETISPLVVIAGVTNEIIINVNAGDGVTPVDITGCLLAFAVALFPGGTRIYTTDSSAIGEIFIQDVAHGVATLRIDSAAFVGTNVWNGLPCVASLYLTDAAGVVWNVWGSTVQIQLGA
jgi:hypothetical protein